MTRKQKARLAVIAVFAFSAIAASAAQAEYNLTPAKSPAWITAEQIAHQAGNKFELTSRGTRYECSKVTYKGTVTGLNVTDATLTPSFEGCTANGELAMTVDVNGCTITLTGHTNAAGEGELHLLCPEGKQVEFTIPAISCTLKVHEQTPTSGGFKYTNTEEVHPDDVDATASLVGITYERVGTSTGCVASAPKEGNDTDLLTNIDNPRL